MKFGVVAGCVVLAVVSSVSASSRIIGGSNTTIETYPSIVQVEFSTNNFWAQSCGGTILNSFYIVSAAHCFSGRTFTESARRIRAGSTTRGSGGTVFEVQTVIIHPSYDSRTLDGDITVVRLASQITLGTTMASTVVIAQDFAFPANVPVELVGWGATSSTGSHADDLQVASVQTVDHDVCVERYQSLTFPRNVTDNMICAGLLGTGGVDACWDDAGGPMFYENILIGIISWGQGCALANFPGVSTKVASYTDWIVASAV